MIKRMEHVGVVVDDLAAAIEFFTELGLELQAEWSVEGSWADRVVGLDGMKTDVVMLQTADGSTQLEVAKFHAPPVHKGDSHAPSNTLGIRHICFSVNDLDGMVAGLQARGAEFVGTVENYQDIYKLCYVRGPEGILVEIAEKIG